MFQNVTTKQRQLMVIVIILTVFIIHCATEKSHTDYFEYIKETYGKNLTEMANASGIADFDVHFNEYMKRHNKAYYNSQEIEYRKLNYLYSYQLMLKNERDFRNGLVPFKLEMNKFADYGINDHHFIPHNMINWSSAPEKGLGAVENGNPIAYPVNFDWRDQGVIAPVQDQGACGSCWIFAGVTVVESANAIVGNPLVDLSEQQLMDCVGPPNYVSNGCNGGTVDDVYRFAKSYGIVMERSYPYTGMKGNCQNGTSQWNENIYYSHFLPIPATDNDIMHTIYQYGPVAVVINAGDKEFHLYQSGILTDAGDRDLIHDQNNNHYVSIVGWGTDNGYDYWIVRNSWGPSWGENGYVKLLRGINNRGINTVVSYAEANLSDSKKSPPTYCTNIFFGTYPCNANASTLSIALIWIVLFVIKDLL